MTPSLSAEFDTRRDAEMAIEHIVQEYDLDRNAVSVFAASPDNSAGVRVAGSDVEDNGAGARGDSKPALAGRVRVSVDIEAGSIDKVLASFATYNGRPID